MPSKVSQTIAPLHSAFGFQLDYTTSRCQNRVHKPQSPATICTLNLLSGSSAAVVTGAVPQHQRRRAEGMSLKQLQLRKQEAAFFAGRPELECLLQGVYKKFQIQKL